MRILFCNITYMNKYIGITDDDKPLKGGVWVEKNKDANEQWNFLNNNGYCYGFVMNKGEQFAIERIDEKAINSEKLDDVIIIWCALNNNDETVIVGWYENATVYRHYQNSITTPAYGIDCAYFASAKAEDCYLLPEYSRKFTIGRASKDGAGKGFGQQNYWYAESSYARDELIPMVIDFINAHRNERINRIAKDFELPKNVFEPLTLEEENIADGYFDNNEYFKFLPYGYRVYHATKSADDAYFIAEALAALHQYDSAIKWYKEVIAIEGKSWEIESKFLYLYQQCEMYSESTELAMDLFKYKETLNEEVRDEIYSIIADNYYYSNNAKLGIEWLDKILLESKNEELKKHTEFVKSKWSKVV